MFADVRSKQTVFTWAEYTFDLELMSWESLAVEHSRQPCALLQALALSLAGDLPSAQALMLQEWNQSSDNDDVRVSGGQGPTFSNSTECAGLLCSVLRGILPDSTPSSSSGRMLSSVPLIILGTQDVRDALQLHSSTASISKKFLNQAMVEANNADSDIFVDVLSPEEEAHSLHTACEEAFLASANQKQVQAKLNEMAAEAQLPALEGCFPSLPFEDRG